MKGEATYGYMQRDPYRIIPDDENGVIYTKHCKEQFSPTKQATSQGNKNFILRNPCCICVVRRERCLIDYEGTAVRKKYT